MYYYYYYYYGRRDRKTWQPFGAHVHQYSRLVIGSFPAPRSSGRAVNQTRGLRVYIYIHNIIHARHRPSARSAGQKHCGLSEFPVAAATRQTKYILLLLLLLYAEIRVTSVCGRARCSWFNYIFPFSSDARRPAVASRE